MPAPCSRVREPAPPPASPSPKSSPAQSILSSAISTRIRAQYQKPPAASIAKHSQAGRHFSISLARKQCRPRRPRLPLGQSRSQTQHQRETSAETPKQTYPWQTTQPTSPFERGSPRQPFSSCVSSPPSFSVPFSGSGGVPSSLFCLLVYLSWNP